MAKNIPWYDEERFWREMSSFLFYRGRLAATPEETENLIQLLALKPGARILDLCCGRGRHSLELARRGYHVTGVDRTAAYLRKARADAKKEKLDVEFVKSDMREFVRPDTFDAAINMFTSFGYFEDIEDDFKVVANLFSSLKGGGKLLIDTMGKEIIARIFRERDWHELDGNILLEEREVSRDWSWMETRWILLRGDRRDNFTLSLRLYSAAELSGLVQRAGFEKLRTCGSLAGDPYNVKAKRMVLVARKRKQPSR